MFEKINNFAGQIQLLQKFMQDENFRKLIAHPKIQRALQDPEVREVIKTKNPILIMNHPKILTIIQDPELSALTAQLKK